MRAHGRGPRGGPVRQEGPQRGQPEGRPEGRHAGPQRGQPEGRQAGRQGAQRAGFTLLEVLIALIIASIAIAALMRAGAAGLSATDTASRYEEAVARARSHLEAASHGTRLIPSDNQGSDGGGFRWRVRVARVAATAIQPFGPGLRPPVPVALYQISVWIFWGSGGAVRAVRLDTDQVEAASP
jgi:general secretion pathway protein I